MSLAPKTITRIGWIKGQPRRFIFGHHMRVPAYQEAARERKLGTKESQATREKKRRAMEGRHEGERNPMWKGDQAGYFALHNWVHRRKIKTGTCSHCERGGKTEWANISREYRRDLADWIELCRRCHVWFDHPGGWAKGFDVCITCGTTERPHKARGECLRCYGRRRKKEAREKKLVS